MNDIVLQVNDLRIHLKPGPHAPQGRTLLEACSFALQAGERLTMVGESGAGKSLLAQAIMGTLPAALQASGSVRIGNVATNGQRTLTQPLWGRTVMMLPQEPWSALSPLMRMQSQVAEAARFARDLPWSQAQDAAGQRLQTLGLGPAAQQWLHQISGGMAQRVGVACASVAHAQLLIADEPTKGLDPRACEQVAQLLMAAQTEGQALLTITHDLDLAQQLGGQIAVLRQGRIVEQGPAQQVIQHPQHAYTRALVAAQPRHWPAYPFAARSDAPPLLEARGLSKRFGARSLFERLDLTLRAGEVVAISGPSGCGKTTLGNVLLGIAQADAGQVQRPPELPVWKFQKLYQDPPAAFSPFRTLGQALDDVRQRHRLHALPGADQTRWMQALGLDAGLLARLPHEVSGGELQRFSLLRLLLLRPAFIFADEPTSRLDPITQRNTMQVLCEGAAQSGCSVLLVSHDADLARTSSQRHIAMPLH
ncbi:MAG: ATP-binding cassette domain-containing protein [Burkholderiaceae bacterium]|nr:ATP-binding cassette domain-containing protein [Burkholderiaceae bacterium]